MERQTITGSLSTSGRLSGALSVGGGTTDYNELENKPTYNGHVIEGDLTSELLGIWQPKNFSTQEQSTGLKWLDGKDIYFKSFIIENVTSGDHEINAPIPNLNEIIIQTGTWDRLTDTNTWTYNINAQNELSAQPQFNLLCRYRNTNQTIYINVGNVYAPVLKIRLILFYTKVGE